MSESFVTFERPTHRVRALFRGHLIADSDSAVIASIPGRGSQVFFPKDDVEMTALSAADHTPASQGQATIYTIMRDGRLIEDFAFSFEGPLVADELRGMISFDPKWTDIEEDVDGDRLWAGEADRMRDYIMHTDSGSGRSQAEPWAPNVARPGEESLEDDEDENLPPPRFF